MKTLVTLDTLEAFWLARPACERMGYLGEETTDPVARYLQTRVPDTQTVAVWQIGDGGTYFAEVTDRATGVTPTDAHEFELSTGVQDLVSLLDRFGDIKGSTMPMTREECLLALLALRQGYAAGYESEDQWPI